MKCNLANISVDQFDIKEYSVGGEIVYLVSPQLKGVTWTQENKHYRSSVWTAGGELISAGFPKFTNWGENPIEFPVPVSLNNATVVAKLDGSLLIVSKYKDNLILRTRGTVDASLLENGFELQEFKSSIIPKLIEYKPHQFNPLDSTWTNSILFEWTSPFQRIVLNYGDVPTWTLIGAINHEHYSLWTQAELSKYAESAGLSRPETYTFASIEELLSAVEDWRGKEGVVIYSGNDQKMHKVKSAWYLVLHRMKEELSSFDKVVDCFYSQGEPTYIEFEQFIISQFDFELWTQVRGDVSRICGAQEQIKKIIDGMQSFIDQTLKQLPSRRLQAEKVIAAYGNTNRASFVFKLLDKKELSRDDRKKLMYQVIKK